MKTNILFFSMLVLIMTSCSQKNTKFYHGADLSYVNEMLDCGGIYRENGKVVNPYELFGRKGCDLVRVRLWHTPAGNGYSGFEDVKRTITQAKLNHMEVLLDFHYSDSWADPQKQIIPTAWENIKDLRILGDSVFQYTLNTLIKLNAEDLFPEFIQVGNETNIEILQNDTVTDNTINWRRNIYLLNMGIYAVKKAEEITGNKTQIMLHIAQPENALWWFRLAQIHGIAAYDWIALSYYPKWSKTSMSELPKAIDSLKTTYKKHIMIVETAYPYTLLNIDNANNLLGEDAVLPDYPATPDGQLKYLLDLTRISQDAGCGGIVYWEPAWISTKCHTLWGQGSHWDNATFFDASRGNEALPAFSFFNFNE